MFLCQILLLLVCFAAALEDVAHRVSVCHWAKASRTWICHPGYCLAPYLHLNKDLVISEVHGHVWVCARVWVCACVSTEAC